MIKNVIFDIGGVLMNFHADEYIQLLGYSGQQADELVEVIGNPRIWHGMDVAEFETYHQAMEAAVKDNPAFEKQIRQFYNGPWMETIYKPLKQNQILLEIAKAKGYGIYLLSNYSLDGFKYLEDHYDFIANVDGKIVSSHVKCSKPDLEIYQLLLDKYHLKAEECVFFDDTLANIQAANSLGIHGHWLKDINEALKML